MDSNTFEAESATAAYLPPAITRLGTLGDLTRGGAGTIEDTFNGGWQGSFLPP